MRSAPSATRSPGRFACDARLRIRSARAARTRADQWHDRRPQGNDSGGAGRPRVRRRRSRGRLPRREALARSYAEAAHALAALELSPADAGSNARLVAALRGAAAAYRQRGAGGNGRQSGRLPSRQRGDPARDGSGQFGACRYQRRRLQAGRPGGSAESGAAGTAGTAARPEPGARATSATRAPTIPATTRKSLRRRGRLAARKRRAATATPRRRGPDRGRRSRPRAPCCPRCRAGRSGSRSWRRARCLGSSIRLSGAHVAPPLGIVAFGGAVMAAAFMLAAAAEAAEIDVSPGLAVAGVAFVAVLPEYVIEVYFAFSGHVEYVTASLTGSTRLLLGFAVGMPALASFVLARRGGERVETVEIDPRRRDRSRRHGGRIALRARDRPPRPSLLAGLARPDRAVRRVHAPHLQRRPRAASPRRGRGGAREPAEAAAAALGRRDHGLLRRRRCS